MASTRIYFYRKDGSEQTSRQYFAPGRFYIDQDMEIWNVEPEQYQPGSVHHIHCGHGSYRDYVVEERDEHTVVLRQL